MPSSTLFAGVGRRDISPSLGTPLMGYPDPRRKAESLRDPLYVTALVLEGRDPAGGRRRVAIVTFDLCVLANETAPALLGAVGEAAGVTPDAITLAYSHTHSGPNTMTCWGWCEIDRPFIEALIPMAAEAAAEAAAKLAPVRMGVGATQSDVGINRRQVLEDHTVGLGVNPWGPYDPTMTVLRFEAAGAAADGEAGEGSTVATLVHYGAHPTVFSGETRAISRDWPGIMTDRLEQLTGAPALFVNGALGDVAPRSNFRSAVGDGEIALLEVGTRAASDAVRAFRGIRQFDDVPVATLSRRQELPYRPLPPLDEARRRVEETRADREKPGAGMCEFRHWSAVVEAHGRPAEAAGSFEQTITALGPVALVPLPGEPFAEIILRIREHSPFQHTLCASCANGHFGYLVTRESLARGGYEVWVAKAFGPRILAENIDDVLVEQNVRLLRELNRRLASTATSGTASPAKS